MARLAAVFLNVCLCVCVGYRGVLPCLSSVNQVVLCVNNTTFSFVSNQHVVIQPTNNHHLNSLSEMTVSEVNALCRCGVTHNVLRHSLSSTKSSDDELGGNSVFRPAGLRDVCFGSFSFSR